MRDSPDYHIPVLIGKSNHARALRKQIALLAASDVNVLISGESGVGKEIAARLLHLNSQRRHGPFIAVNCAALSPGILESELFGHDKGAFTGAFSAHAGFFEQADEGSLFLDEIAEMPPAMQMKLLRILQSREVRRMGSAGTRKVNIRLLSATNADLEERIESSGFRRDLYYRINVVQLQIQPLKARPEDILELIAHFCSRKNRPELKFDKTARNALLNYSWPGNIRELENEIERLHALYGGVRTITSDMISEKIAAAQSLQKTLDLKLLYDAPLADAVGELEQNILRRTLMATRWNKSRTARRLGISRQGLIKKIKRYGLFPEPFIIEDNDQENNCE